MHYSAFIKWNKIDEFKNQSFFKYEKIFIRVVK
jgi:hypothetical protein